MYKDHVTKDALINLVTCNHDIVKQKIFVLSQRVRFIVMLMYLRSVTL